MVEEIEETLATQLHCVTFRSKWRSIDFFTADDDTAEKLKELSKEISSAGKDPDTNEYDPNLLPKGSDLIEDIRVDFGNKIAFHRIIDISSEKHRNAKPEDIIRNYPNPAKVAERSADLEAMMKVSSVQSGGAEIGSSALFVILALLTSDASTKDIVKTVVEALPVLIPLGYSWHVSNQTEKKHRAAKTKYEETKDERVFDELGTGMQTITKFDHTPPTILGAFKDAARDIATIFTPKGFVLAPLSLVFAKYREEARDPFNYGIYGGICRYAYTNARYAWNTLHLKKAVHTTLKAVQNFSLFKQNSEKNEANAANHITVEKSEIPKAPDHYQLYYLPHDDVEGQAIQDKRIIKSSVPGSATIQSITAPADPERIEVCKNAIPRSIRQGHIKIGTGLIGVAAAGWFCHHIVPYVITSMQQAYSTPSPETIGIAATWYATIAMGAAAAKHFMVDREKTQIEIENNQVFALEQAQIQEHLNQVRDTLKERLRTISATHQIDAVTFEEIISLWKQIDPEALDSETIGLFNIYFPTDEKGRITTNHLEYKQPHDQPAPPEISEPS